MSYDLVPYSDSFGGRVQDQSLGLSRFQSPVEKYDSEGLGCEREGKGLTKRQVRLDSKAGMPF